MLNKSKAPLKRHQILGKEGAFEILEYLYIHKESLENEIIDYLGGYFGKNEIAERISELRKIWFIEVVPKTQKLRITDDGKEAYLLARVINGEALDSFINQLSRLAYRRFSLIMEDITGHFLSIIRTISNVQEIYMCSPWIRLPADDLKDFEKLLEKSENKISINLITLPPQEIKQSTPWETWTKQIMDTLRWFYVKGAEIVAHPDLHTKLYIVIARDTQLAIFGSENLTGAGNIELGIKITDESVVKKLLTYWQNIYNECRIVDWGDLQ